jgi:hypothetical protein
MGKTSGASQRADHATNSLWLAPGDAKQGISTSHKRSGRRLRTQGANDSALLVRAAIPIRCGQVIENIECCGNSPLRAMLALEVTLQDYMSASFGWGKIFQSLVAWVRAGGYDPGASADLSIFPRALLGNYLSSLAVSSASLPRTPSSSPTERR